MALAVNLRERNAARPRANRSPTASATSFLAANLSCKSSFNKTGGNNPYTPMIVRRRIISRFLETPDRKSERAALLKQNCAPGRLPPVRDCESCALR